MPGRSGALHGAQPVADLLETGAELALQALDVMARGPGRGMEAAIGQHQRAGEIIGQRDAGQAQGLGGGKILRAATRFSMSAFCSSWPMTWASQKISLSGATSSAKYSRFAVRLSRQNTPAPSSPRRRAGGDAMGVAQIAPQIVPQRGGGEIIRLEQGFRRAVERIEMILPRLHPVPHLVIGKARQFERRGGKLLGLGAIGAVELHEGIGKGGAVRTSARNSLGARGRARNSGSARSSRSWVSRLASSLSAK